MAGFEVITEGIRSNEFRVNCVWILRCGYDSLVLPVVRVPEQPATRSEKIKMTAMIRINVTMA